MIYFKLQDKNKRLEREINKELEQLLLLKL